MLEKLARLLLLLSLCTIDLVSYEWFRRRTGGTWYYASLLVDLGRMKIYWWTRADLGHHVIKKEQY